MDNLSKNNILSKLSSLDDEWELVDRPYIKRAYKFDSFKEGLDFVNKIAAIAEEIDHHPYIYFCYRSVILKIFTHDTGSITELDFQLIELIDEIVDNSKNEVLEKIEILKNGSNFERRKAANRLGNLKDGAAIPSLIKALDDNDRFVIKNAARSLGKIGDSKSIPALIKLSGHNDSEIRWSAKESLLEIGPTSCKKIQDVINSRNRYQREIVVELLEELECDAAGGLIKKSLFDKEPTVRWRAARNIFKWYDNESIESLKKLANNDPDSKVRKEADSILKEIRENVKRLYDQFEKSLKFIDEDIISKDIKWGKSFSILGRKFFTAHFFTPYNVRFYIYCGSQGIKGLDKIGNPNYGAISLERDDDLEKILQIVKESYMIAKQNFS
ncbi:MAG: HEAT repeat domain-containing protein [Methanomicrobiales archaeon]